MKTLKKNAKLLAAFAAALIVSAALIAGCLNPIPAPGEWSYTPPEGMGVVRLVFGKSIGRTIMPDTTPGSAYTGIDLVLVLADDGPPPGPGTAGTYSGIVAGDGSFTVIVPPGEYKLSEVIAKVTAGPVASASGNAIVVEGDKLLTPNVQANGFKIEEGEATEINITLTAIGVVTSQSGTLGWDIDLATSLAALSPETTISVFPYPLPVTPSGTTYDVDDTFPTILSGYYWVDVFVDASDNGDFTYRDIVHIYQNMTSIIKLELEVIDLNIESTPSGGDITFELPDLAGTAVVTPTGTYTGNGSRGDPYQLSRSANHSLTLEVTTNPFYNDEVTWTVNGEELGDTEDITIIAGTTEGFTRQGLVALALVGEIGGKPYTNIIWIRIVA